MSQFEGKSVENFGGNCTLVAVKYFSGKSDSEILKAAYANGYSPRKGMSDFQQLWMYKSLGVEYEAVPAREQRIYKSDGSYARKLTLREFCQKFTEGVYRVSVDGHALVVHNGIIHDPNSTSGPRTKIRRAYKILNPVVTPKVRKEFKVGDKVRIVHGFRYFFKGMKKTGKAYGLGSKLFSWTLDNSCFSFEEPVFDSARVIADKVMKAGDIKYFIKIGKMEVVS